MVGGQLPEAARSGGQTEGEQSNRKAPVSDNPDRTPASANLRHSPLEDSHRRRGATLTAFAGWLMPLRYGSELAEHRAVRSAAGVFDLSHMAEIAVRGPQAAAALDYALVSELSTIRVGRARYTMACLEDGGILDDLVVYRRSAEDFLVVANAANASVMLAALRTRAQGFDTSVRDVTDEFALIAFQGPKAASLLAPLLDAPVSELGYYTSCPTRVLGTEALLARTGYTGEDGFELFVPTQFGATLFDELLAIGADHGVLACGLAARDSLRLEAGMPLYGNELSEEITPYEAGLGRVVALHKPGDFVGRAALARREAEGVARRLIGLVGESQRAPRHGYRVRAQPEGPEIGMVTSGAPSPTLGRPIAMALVETAYAVTGRSLVVDVRGRAEPVHVHALPFYRRERPAAQSTTPQAENDPQEQS